MFCSKKIHSKYYKYVYNNDNNNNINTILLRNIWTTNKYVYNIML